MDGRGRPFGAQNFRVFHHHLLENPTKCEARNLQNVTVTIKVGIGSDQEVLGDRTYKNCPTWTAPRDPDGTWEGRSGVKMPRHDTNCIACAVESRSRSIGKCRGGLGAACNRKRPHWIIKGAIRGGRRN